MKGRLMKFIIAEQESETTVTLSLELGRTGEVGLCANGVPVLWVNTDGTISLSSLIGDNRLRKMGFQIDYQKLPPTVRVLR